MCEDAKVTPPDPARVAEAVEAFRLLADPTRVRLLWLLRGSRLDVGSLARRAGATATATSQHLAKLRAAGLVTAERDGRHVHYALADDHVARLLEEALSAPATVPSR